MTAKQGFFTNDRLAQGSALNVNGNALLALQTDAFGRLAARKDRVDDRVFVYEYAYDQAGRLARVARNGAAVEAYAYDEAGRRIEDTSTFRHVMGRPHEYDDLGRLRKAGLVEYAYDFADRLASRAEGVHIARYSYDRDGRLKRVQLPDGHVVEYIHDPQGKRIAKLRDGEVAERYYWRDFIRLLAVHDGRDREVVRFDYGGGRVPCAMVHRGKAYRVEVDQVGSPLALVDTEGRVVKRVIYDSFGNIVDDDNPKLPLPLGFAGGLYDKDTGLVHFGYRDYDPDVGRFTTKDPIGYAGGDSDLYGYVLDDPVNRVDPWGLSNGAIEPRVTNSTVAGSAWNGNQNDLRNNTAPTQPLGEAPALPDYAYTYSQSTGELKYVNGTLITTGYSGYDYGKNNATAQNITNIGPLPRGEWEVEALYDSNKTGPNSRRLSPAENNTVYDTRMDPNSFVVHGSNEFGNASRGCLILDPKARKELDGKILVIE